MNLARNCPGWMNMSDPLVIPPASVSRTQMASTCKIRVHCKTSLECLYAKEEALFPPKVLQSRLSALYSLALSLIAIL